MPSVPRGFESSYLAGEAISRTFIPLDFRSGADRRRRTRAAAERRADPSLLAELREQQAALGLSPARAAHLEALAERLGAGPAGEETVALLRAHYRAGVGIAKAFAGVLASVFADEGLLVLDPRVSAVAALAAPIYREALAGSAAIERRL